MFVSPESVGISSLVIENFLRHLNENGFAVHSVMMSRYDKVFLESYWKPFDRETHHRLNSVTKSFVGIAIGFLIQEGKLDFNDKIHTFFPESCPTDIDPDVASLTIYDMLTMRTTIDNDQMHWVRDKVYDRQSYYFSKKATKPPQTFFEYDSLGSFLLGTVVEKITGKPFIEYLKDKCLREMGFSEKTCCIKGPDGYSWSDSGLLCRTIDLHKFGRFLLDGGKFNGKQYLNEEYVRRATSKIVDTNRTGWKLFNANGYGFQIWQTFDGGFSLNGMGGQFLMCFPDYDFIFVCTGDNQGNDQVFYHILADMVHNELIKNLKPESLAENPAALNSLREYESNMNLVYIEGDASTTVADKINGVTYNLQENPMNMKWIRITFSGDEGTFEYENAQGKKALPFGILKNVFTSFPEEGYPDMQMGVREKGNYFPCASSAAWRDDNTLAIKVQMIGKHLGGLYITFSFTENSDIGARFLKNTNCFLHEYSGYARGKSLTT